jgi:8-oxo-dGTP pyrophosphatase MutT (NUDIX family)
MKEIVRQRNDGEPLTIPNGEPTVVHKGRLGAMVAFPVLQDRGEGYIEMTFEKFCRPPGTRLIAVRDNKILLNKEHRLETNGFDWRLPGGKVFDSFEEYEPFLGTKVPVEKIIAGARKELQEEAHLDTDDLTIFDRSICGSSVEWDLYYVVAQHTTDFHLKDHNEGEEIEEHQWFTFDEIEKMCKSGNINEGRSVAILMKFISQ